MKTKDDRRRMIKEAAKSFGKSGGAAEIQSSCGRENIVVNATNLPGSDYRKKSKKLELY